jgi:hypothetical protein
MPETILDPAPRIMGPAAEPPASDKMDLLAAQRSSTESLTPPPLRSEHPNESPDTDLSAECRHPGVNGDDDKETLAAVELSSIKHNTEDFPVVSIPDCPGSEVNCVETENRQENGDDTEQSYCLFETTASADDDNALATSTTLGAATNSLSGDSDGGEKVSKSSVLISTDSPPSSDLLARVSPEVEKRPAAATSVQGAPRPWSTQFLSDAPSAGLLTSTPRSRLSSVPCSGHHGQRTVPQFLTAADPSPVPSYRTAAVTESPVPPTGPGDGPLSLPLLQSGSKSYDYLLKVCVQVAIVAQFNVYRYRSSTCINNIVFTVFILLIISGS